MARRFEIVAGGGTKFWQIALDGKKVNLRWSSDGGEQTQVKKYSNADAAEAEHDRLIRDRLGKGWREVKARAHEPAPEKMASHPELVAQRQAAAKRIGTAGLAHRMPELSPLFRGSIRLVATPQLKIPVGATQIGGEPSLPPRAKWPARGGRALSFVAQIRLEEVAPLDDEKLLPGIGLLSFFVHGDTVKILHSSDSELVRFPLPDRPELALSPSRGCRVTPTIELTLPPAHGRHLEGLQLTADERAKWEKKIAPRDGGIMHRMLGYPDLDRATHFDADTILLLQLDSDPKARLSFGDGERLCVYIPREALLAKAWSRAFCAIGD